MKMLFGQNRGRAQYGDLFIFTDRLKSRPHGDFRLAEADVAAHQPVHRLIVFHIPLDVAHRFFLIGRQCIGKTLLKLRL